MKNTQIIGIALLVGGAIALYFGFNATQSLSGELSEAFTGSYSNETLALLIGGGVAAVAGLFMLIKK